MQYVNYMTPLRHCKQKNIRRVRTYIAGSWLSALKLLVFHTMENDTENMHLAMGREVGQGKKNERYSDQQSLSSKT